MSEVQRQLASLGITLPEVMPPVVAGYVPAFVPYVVSGDHIYVSGRLAKQGGALLIGKLGEELDLEQGRQAARAVALELLAVLQSALGDLDRVQRLVRLFAMVNCSPGFRDVHTVANGASELLTQVLGERGAHARSVFGATQVPFGACMEIDLVAEIKPPGRAPAGYD
jgi:enamine deaminase RidA (YjgF/YER057c/UK114 family)